MAGLVYNKLSKYTNLFGFLENVRSSFFYFSIFVFIAAAHKIFVYVIVILSCQLKKK